MRILILLSREWNDQTRIAVGPSRTKVLMKDDATIAMERELFDSRWERNWRKHHTHFSGEKRIFRCTFLFSPIGTHECDFLIFFRTENLPINYDFVRKQIHTHTHTHTKHGPQTRRAGRSKRTKHRNKWQSINHRKCPYITAPYNNQTNNPPQNNSSTCIRRNTSTHTSACMLHLRRGNSVLCALTECRNGTCYSERIEQANTHTHWMNGKESHTVGSVSLWLGACQRASACVSIIGLMVLS